jgi:hypothetical protein
VGKELVSHRAVKAKPSRSQSASHPDLNFEPGEDQFNSWWHAFITALFIVAHVQVQILAGFIPSLIWIAVLILTVQDFDSKDTTSSRGDLLEMQVGQGVIIMI